ncbi:hypothetical protein [Azospirillum doebereinerae]
MSSAFPAQRPVASRRGTRRTQLRGQPRHEVPEPEPEPHSLLSPTPGWGAGAPSVRHNRSRPDLWQAGSPHIAPPQKPGLRE